MKMIFWLILLVSFVSCRPSTLIEPVAKLDIDRYQGKWYEIARYDNYFEKDLTNVTAEYSIREDGLIKVVNSGYNTKESKWKSIEGKGKRVKADNSGALKVSFFGPFYSPYTVFYIDSDYKHAYVVGEKNKYLWLLAREPVIPEEEKQKFIKEIESRGLDSNKLLWTLQ